MTEFTLTVACSADGFISRNIHEPPQAWASQEEQELFFRDVEAADWAIMGRHTHEAADRPDRHRIVFSTTRSGWQRDTQLWLDPSSLSPQQLAHLVEHVKPLERALILGGQRVHDWFLAHRAIDRVHLTIEPVHFGAGVSIFSNQTERDPRQTFLSAGFSAVQDDILNSAGTRYLVLRPDFDPIADE